MFLKIAIVITFLAMLASLTSGLIFVLKDTDGKESKRALWALGLRVSLALLLILLISYGVYSGQLINTAPWDMGHTA